jgi:hypothetical protein
MRIFLRRAPASTGTLLEIASYIGGVQTLSNTVREVNSGNSHVRKFREIVVDMSTIASAVIEDSHLGLLTKKYAMARQPIGSASQRMQSRQLHENYTKFI